MITKDNLPERGWEVYVKIAPTQMMRMSGEFTVMTKEGPLTCSDGWLALDNEGNPYPISDENQQAMYVKQVL